MGNRIRQLRALRLDDVQVADAGQIIYHASVFGVKDSYGTVFDKGAFKKTINDHAKPPVGIELSPFLDDAPGGFFGVVWFHNPAEPLGLSRVSEDDTGLVVYAELDLDIERGRDIYSGMKRGYINCASHSFSVVTEAKEDGDPHFKEVELFETSPLTMNFASNPVALIDEVRARTGVDYPKPPPTMLTEADLREMLTALQGLQHRELTDGEAELVTEVAAAFRAVTRSTPEPDSGEETVPPAPTDIPTEPPAPIGLPSAFSEVRDLAAALALRGPIRSPLGASRSLSNAPEYHALLADIKALGREFTRLSPRRH